MTTEEQPKVIEFTLAQAVQGFVWVNKDILRQQSAWVDLLESWHTRLEAGQLDRDTLIAEIRAVKNYYLLCHTPCLSNADALLFALTDEELDLHSEFGQYMLLHKGYQGRIDPAS